MEEKQKNVVTMKIGRTKDSRVVRDSLLPGACNTSWDHGGVLSCAATVGHVWVCGPVAARIYYHQSTVDTPGPDTPQSHVDDRGLHRTDPTSFFVIRGGIAWGV